MKLHEEFKEYETMWEGSINEDASPKTRMYTLPDGSEINLIDRQALEAESERLKAIQRELEDQGKIKPVNYYYDDLSVRRASYILTKILQCFYRLENENETTPDNDKIISKLKNYTNIADKVDLEDIRRQLNAGSKAVINKRTQREIERLTDDLRAIYERLGLVK